MMKFTAFPVQTGDSFLLEDNEFKLLVDGGISKTQLNSFLKVKNIDSINVVICTHYDSDHVRGLIGLFKNIIIGLSNIKIREVWLPEIFDRVTNCQEIRRLSLSWNNQEDLYKIIAELMDSDEKKYITKEKENAFKIDTAIKNIVLITLYSSTLQQFGTKIRWFKQANQLVNQDIHIANTNQSSNIFALNCTEQFNRSIKSISISQAVYELTQINKDSLVFRYNEVGKPNVLFTSDSDFNFCNPSTSDLITPRQSIVTAPHHGSSDEDHKKVYSNLKLWTDGDFIFVRSSERKSSRPCCEFLKHNQNLRFCTRCDDHTSNRLRSEEQTLEFYFTSSTWYEQPGVNKCSCLRIC